MIIHSSIFPTLPSSYNLNEVLIVVYPFVIDRCSSFIHIHVFSEQRMVNPYLFNFEEIYFVFIIPLIDPLNF